jgi:hypothetical protein
MTVLGTTVLGGMEGAHNSLTFIGAQRKISMFDILLLTASESEAKPRAHDRSRLQSRPVVGAS